MATNSLLYFEDLTIPHVQVVVMSGSMGCARCRQRLSQLTSKIKGLREYTVDMLKKQVTIKAEFHNKLKQKDRFNYNHEINKHGCFLPLKFFFRSFLRDTFK